MIQFAGSPLIEDSAGIADRASDRAFCILNRSALVNIRRKALLSSVGFRKRMTSRSPRGSSCDSCKLRFDRPL